MVTRRHEWASSFSHQFRKLCMPFLLTERLKKGRKDPYLSFCPRCAKEDSLIASVQKLKGDRMKVRVKCDSCTFFVFCGLTYDRHQFAPKDPIQQVVNEFRWFHTDIVKEEIKLREESENVRKSTEGFGEEQRSMEPGRFTDTTET